MLIWRGPAATSFPNKITDNKISPIITPKTNKEASSEGVRPVSWLFFELDCAMGKNLQNYFVTTGSLAKITCRDDPFTLLR